MNDYDLLSLIDTYNAAKKQGLPVPSTMAEFLTGLTPIDDGNDLVTPQIGQGTTTYEQGISDVEARDRTANIVTNDLNLGQSQTGHPALDKFSPFPKKPFAQHAEAMDHKSRLDVRREIGYDK